MSNNIYKPSPTVDKQFILRHLSQERIMEYYLGVQVQYQRMFRSPLRVDHNPTCVFSWDGGKLWFRDWADYKPLDIFDVVKEKYVCNFYEAIQIIAEDFGLKDNETTRKLATSSKPKEQTKRHRNSEKSEIQVKIQKFTDIDIDYLTSYGIHSETVKKFNVFSPKYVWLDGEPFYVYSEENPALAYYFGKDEKGHQKWKIYFYQKRGDFRFLGNTSRINGWIQIPDEGDLLVLTKSLKDVMALYEFDIDAVAMQGESTIPYGYIIEELENRFSSIITLYDHDKAGMRYAKKIHELYGLPYCFITEDSLGIDPGEAKDFSDFVKLHEKEDVCRLVDSIQQKANGYNPGCSGEEPADLQQKAPKGLEKV